ncbi:MAG TPA: hypothetical protein DFS52_24655 [Myxococcales bacterium]|jgi:hypothetical protein|nr:hypothetical protein [Myxococcales bacterium]
MKTATIVLDICSYWHAGTGRGAGTTLDALVFKSAAGLPVLPGRTVRGLLRDALEKAARLRAVDETRFERGPATWCFGTGLDATAKESEPVNRVERLEEARFRTDEGKLQVDSATLGDSPEEARKWERWAAGSPGEVEHLYRGFASTKIGPDGVVADHTLRSIEVTVPLRLYARVSGPEEGPDWIGALREALPLIRGLGSHRNRGLGRVKAYLAEEGRR